jgi:membrane-associated phospholipid phosphatase
MYKVIGGVLIGIFLGTVFTEIFRRKRPDLFEAIEARGKEWTDRLFEGMRQSYDFSEPAKSRSAAGHRRRT